MRDPNSKIRGSIQQLVFHWRLARLLLENIITLLGYLVTAGTLDDTATIAAAIERHLRAFPDAADTTDGVRDWWLGGRYSSAAVLRALEELARSGVVNIIRTAGGVAIVSRGTKT